MSNQQLLYSSIDPKIDPLIKCVLKSGTFGICRKKIDVKSISSSNGNTSDRFNLSVPYADETLTWTVLFNLQCPELGPDFIFNNDAFLADADIEILEECVPSLVRWNPHDENALLNVLTELLSFYKQHQVQLLTTQAERLQFEYSHLTHIICEENVEVLLTPAYGRPMEARFMIRIPMDFSELPGCNLLQDNAVMLLVTFYGPDWNRIVPQLRLPKPVQDIFEEFGAFSSPSFSTDKLLMDYIPEISSLIEDKVDKIITNFEKKRDFIANMISLQNGSVLEWDIGNFSTMSMLFQQNDFHCLAHFSFSQKFPNEKYKLVLESVYHMASPNRLYKEFVTDFPYSPQWEPKIMVSKLLKHLSDKAIAKFQTNSFKCNR